MLLHVYRIKIHTCICTCSVDTCTCMLMLVNQLRQCIHLAVDEKMKEVNSSIRTKLSFFPIQQKGQKGEIGDATFGAVSP